jgi:hypothetical protein
MFSSGHPERCAKLNVSANARAGSEAFMQSLHSLLIPITRTLPSIEGFAAAHQVFAFLKRLSLRDVKELSSIAYSAWYEVETRDWPTQVGGPESDIVSEWFPASFKASAYEKAAPRHGTGSTAESVSDLPSKMLSLYITTDAIALMEDSGWTFNAEMQRMAYTEETLERPNLCVVRFVPKSWKTFRTISMEPIVTMYWQQFIGSAIDRVLLEHLSDFSQHYAINTENRNRDLAWEGSVNGGYSTIDLSSASDTVPWNLVCEWFADTWLMPGLRLTRTEYAMVEVNGIEVKVCQKKFAPMGSRLCFPVETIVFGAICEACIRNITGYPASRDDYVVYGDDIVIRTEYVQPVLDRLAELGFLVNNRKTYTNACGSWFFRESCGGEYLNAEDVTPVMIPRPFIGLMKPRSSFKSPTQIGGLIELANNLYRYPLARLAIVDNLINRCHLPILFDDGTVGLWSPHPSNAHLMHGWNVDYQREEVYAFGIERTTARWCYDTTAVNNDIKPYLDEIRLFEYLKLTDGRDSLTWPEDAFNATYDQYSEPRAACHWRPLKSTA